MVRTVGETFFSPRDWELLYTYVSVTQAAFAHVFWFSIGKQKTRKTFISNEFLEATAAFYRFSTIESQVLWCWLIFPMPSGHLTSSLCRLDSLLISTNQRTGKIREKGSFEKSHSFLSADASVSEMHFLIFFDYPDSLSIASCSKQRVKKMI